MNNLKLLTEWTPFEYDKDVIEEQRKANDGKDHHGYDRPNPELLFEKNARSCHRLRHTARRPGHVSLGMATAASLLFAENIHGIHGVICLTDKRGANSKNFRTVANYTLPRHRFPTIPATLPRCLW